MTVTELIDRCSEAGLPCNRNRINYLAGKGVIAGQEGGGGQARMGHYPPGTDFRLLAALTLQQPPPRGLNYSIKELLAFLGAVGAERTVDEFLPAVVYALGVPGADAGEARQAGIRFLKKQLKEAREEDRRLEANPGRIPSPLEAQVNIGMGKPRYWEKEIFDNPDDAPASTLRDELNDALSLPEWMKPFSLTSEEWAKVAQISHSKTHRKAMESAPVAILQDAALVARLSMLAFGCGPEPRGKTLLALWGVNAAIFYYVPAALHLFTHMMKPCLIHPKFSEALGLLQDKTFCKAMERGDLDAAAIVISNELCPLD